MMWVSTSLNTNEISLCFEVKVTSFSWYSAKYQAMNNQKPHGGGDVMLCFAMLHYTMLRKVQGWAIVLSLHEDLCERSVPGGGGYLSKKKISSTQGYSLLLTLNSNLS